MNDYNKQICMIMAPFASRSGYGAMSRDIIRHIIESYPDWNVQLISMPWGQTPLNALDETDPKDIPLVERTVIPPIQLPRKPEVFIQISVPNEFQPQGKTNIGITAGIETTICSAQWLEGMNRMDVNFTISEHSKKVFDSTAFERRDHSGNVLGVVKLEKPLEILHNCIDLNVYKYLKDSELEKTVSDELSQINEDFCFLFAGHWLKGGLREDRKNVGLLVKLFCETFRDVDPKKRPALILKTSGAGFSIMDQEEILSKIQAIRGSVSGNLPNIYLLHGDLTDVEMNSLYNHPKVKVMVSLTKGEGFGKPLLEFTQSNKPVIASGWSGQLDFLDVKNALLIGGKLEDVEPGAVWENVILPNSQWFNVDEKMVRQVLQYAYRDYHRTLDGAYRLAKLNREKFAYEVIRGRTKELLDKYVPPFAVQVPMKLPTLKKAVRSDV